MIRGSFDHTSRELKKLIKTVKPAKIVAVGDRVSENMLKNGIPANVLIVDNRIMRRPIKPIAVNAEETLYLKNPAGTITDEAWRVIGEALKTDKRVRILVEGEEDLLALVAALCAPENSVVIYGQPREGVVVIRVTEDVKETLFKLVDEMECRD
ncbi:MAG: DUF359 domain-containing protein [Candidatus Bathyarchaeia archaeon]